MTYIFAYVPNIAGARKDLANLGVTAHDFVLEDLEAKCYSIEMSEEDGGKIEELGFLDTPNIMIEFP